MGRKWQVSVSVQLEGLQQLRGNLLLRQASWSCHALKAEWAPVRERCHLQLHVNSYKESFADGLRSFPLSQQQILTFLSSRRNSYTGLPKDWLCPGTASLQNPVLVHYVSHPDPATGSHILNSGKGQYRVRAARKKRLCGKSSTSITEFSELWTHLRDTQTESHKPNQTQSSDSKWGSSRTSSCWSHIITQQQGCSNCPPP